MSNPCSLLMTFFNMFCICNLVLTSDALSKMDAHTLSNQLHTQKHCPCYVSECCPVSRSSLTGLCSSVLFTETLGVMITCLRCCIPENLQATLLFPILRYSWHVKADCWHISYTLYLQVLMSNFLNLYQLIPNPISLIVHPVFCVTMYSYFFLLCTWKKWKKQNNPTLTTRPTTGLPLRQIFCNLPLLILLSCEKWYPRKHSAGKLPDSLKASTNTLKTNNKRFCNEHVSNSVFEF